MGRFFVPHEEGRRGAGGEFDVSIAPVTGAIGTKKRAGRAAIG